MPLNGKEKGYILAECVALCLVAIILAGGLSLFRGAYRADKMSMARTTAIFLGEAQLAYLEQYVHDGGVPTEDIDYLGNAEDTRQNGLDLTVKGSVMVYESHLYKVAAVVSCDALEEDIVFERLVQHEN